MLPCSIPIFPLILYHNLELFMKQAILFLFLLTYTLSTVNAQSLKELQEQRQKTEESIALTNKMLEKNSKSKNQELSNLKLLSRKITYREKLISDINKETAQLEKVISEKELTIGSYNTDLEVMKANYAELIQYIWTRRSSYDQMMYVLAGKDVGQIYRRFRYLNEFSAYQKSQATAIQDLSQRLIIEKDSLEIQRNEQKTLLKKYSTETKKLEGEQNSKSKKVDSLKKQEKTLKRQLIAEQKKRNDLKKFVEKLIAEEARKANKDTSGKMKLTPEQELTSNQFADNKGKFPWPVANGVIDEPFGKHKHEVYSRVEVDNIGVDIRTGKGSNARSIFDGKVTSVIALPGYNKGVIVQHGKYFTFYANLSEVYVKKGDIVSTKQKIGKVYADNNGISIIHFEVYKYTPEKTNPMVNQNPQLWLSK